MGLAAMPSRLRADAAIRNSPSGMRRVMAHGRVLSRRYLCRAHPLVLIVLVPDGADIRAVQRGQDRVQSPDPRRISASGVVAAV